MTRPTRCWYGPHLGPGHQPVSPGRELRKAARRFNFPPRPGTLGTRVRFRAMRGDGSEPWPPARTRAETAARKPAFQKKRGPRIYAG